MTTMSPNGLYLYSNPTEHDPGPNRFFLKREALRKLLESGNLFVNYVPYPYAEDDGLPPETQTITLYVNANDLFTWACSEGVPIGSNTELEQLVNMHLKEPGHGASKWCCIKRNMKPQNPVAEQMRKAGVWDNVMEQLPDNPGWNQCWAPGPCALHNKD